MEFQAKWIRASQPTGNVCPVFRHTWELKGNVKHAEFLITALGVYEAELNGKRVSSYVLAPGWTSYSKRLQYQSYDITEMLKDKNEIRITVGKGWFSSRIARWVENPDHTMRTDQPNAIWGEIHIFYQDGTEEILTTDKDWEWSESPVRFSDIYDGETFHANFTAYQWEKVEEFVWPKEILIPQEGEEIREMERVAAKSVFYTPGGELLVDFGQEVTGYVEFSVSAKAGDKIRILHGEVLDKHGNFYNENYRDAKAEINYICRDGEQTWHPKLTFFGFRYLKLDKFPGKPKAEQFQAVVVYSNIRQTGDIQCGNACLNQLISNIFWGQKGNYLDVPTDCPQRDERFGWTGDTQVFVKTASYNYDVERFFRKWLRDLKAEQGEDGGVPKVIPNHTPDGRMIAAWGDAATICPWQIYQTYGNKEILQEQFESMKGWVDYITSVSKDRYLWTGGKHCGDWLGLDAPAGSYKGASREDFIASAFYAYSTELVVKAGHIIGKDVCSYEELYARIVEKFRKKYTDYRTQTEHVLALKFHLTEEPQKTADALAAMIKSEGISMKTGFLGTPYLLHVLSEHGYTDIAYSLLLRKKYPAWLYSVEKGATTIWEHWDGIMENGEFWSSDMNSFNHYAYGSVADWIYEKAAGIQPDKPGFESAVIVPNPDERLGWLDVSLDTRHGKIKSAWKYTDGGVRYNIQVEMPARIIVGQREYAVEPGKYTFWENKEDTFV